MGEEDLAAPSAAPSAATFAARARAPWHLWVVGGASTIWNAIGAFDFSATITRFEPYMSGFSQELKDHWYALPVWMFLIWGVAVWGGFVGSLVLLARSKLSAPFLAASLTGAVAFFAIGFVRPAPQGANDPVLGGFIVAVAAILLGYAIWMQRRGVLR